MLVNADGDLPLDIVEGKKTGQSARHFWLTILETTGPGDAKQCCFT